MPILKEAVGTAQDKRELAGHIQEQLRSSGQFTPVLRFTLSDKQNRLFDAERMCYRGGIEDWINIECYLKAFDCGGIYDGAAIYPLKSTWISKILTH
jgi:hypothetical protein